MINFARKLKRELEIKLHRIDRRDAAMLEKSREAVILLNDAFNQMKAFVLACGFRDVQEEIYFFKHIKPLLSGHLIYRRKVFNYEMNRPVGGKDTQQAYLNKELARIQDYQDTHQEFYRYYRAGQSFDDCRYFVRGSTDKATFMEISAHERDPLYSTAWDDMAARVMAGDMLRFFLEDEQRMLDGLAPVSAFHRRRKKDLECKADKLHLFEFAVAFHAVKAFPGATLPDVVERVEEMTGIRLGNNHSRSMQKLRDRNEPAPFLNLLLDKYHERINRQRSRKRGNNNR